MPFEVLKLSRDEAALKPRELRALLAELQLGDLGEAHSMPIELDQLEDLLSVRDHVALGLTEDDAPERLARIARTIERQGIWIGKRYAIRPVRGARRRRA